MTIFLIQSIFYITNKEIFNLPGGFNMMYYMCSVCDYIYLDEDNKLEDNEKSFTKLPEN